MRVSLARFYEVVMRRPGLYRSRSRRERTRSERSTDFDSPATFGCISAIWWRLAIPGLELALRLGSAHKG